MYGSFVMTGAGRVILHVPKASQESRA